MSKQSKKEMRIWSHNGKLGYYNFKSKKELPKEYAGDMAVVNDRLVILNPYTNRWNFVKT